MNILEIGFRIKQAIGLTGYNVKDFCERTNRSRVTTAIWIAGRGGVIKESSLFELCLDLQKCNVQCDINWLKTGIGPSPTLISSATNNQNIKSTKNTLDINFNELTHVLDTLDNKHYFKFSDKKQFIIGFSISPQSLIKLLNQIVIILTMQDECITGTLTGFCKKSSTVVITTFNNKIHCVELKDIKKSGQITLLLNQLINN